MVSRGSHCDFRGHERAAVVGPVLPADPESTRAWLVSEPAALDRLGPPAVCAELGAACGDLDQLRRDCQDLDHGTGGGSSARGVGLPRELDIARQECRTAEHGAELPVGDVNGATGAVSPESQPWPMAMLGRIGSPTPSA